MAKKQPDKTDADTKATKAAPEAAAKAAPEAAGEKEKKKTSPKTKGGKPPEAPVVEAASAKTDPDASSPPLPGQAEAPHAEGDKKKKGKAPGTAPRRGKKLRAKIKSFVTKIEQQGPVPLRQALQVLKEGKRAKFDETVEIHMWLGIDPKQSDQMVRGSVTLPHGIGKSVRLLVFTQGDNAVKAKEAGADFVGSDDLAKRIQGEGWLEFDAALATPDMMGVVGRLGKILGPRGLMPTPKAGTVITGDVAAAVREFKAGKVEYRADAGGNVHAAVGKLSFDVDKLVGNATAFIDQIRAAKPASAKGNYIRSITVSATMSPGVPVSA